ncbi:MAG: DsbA family oxidoreductase [Alphaproteobacteria bacterium]
MTGDKAARRVRVDVVSDVICPWCFIGKRNLEAALASRPDIAVDVHWRAFQLNPDMPRDGMERRAYLEAKFGRSDGGGIYERVTAAGQRAGIDFAFDRIARTPNTVAAHRLIALAAEEDRQDAVVEALFDGYFRAGRDIGSLDQLAALAQTAGLSEVAIEKLRGSDAAEADVLAEDEIARQSGIHGVPCFIVDRAFAVSGAQPPETLAAALDHALAMRDQAVA